ncbi:MAG: hypothetical protein K0R38_6311 [Polyangiaceae bacterium]|jgi:hypothetical protein|nr:hypothetical protein [Polyangiaceae bacterium]
MLGVGLACNASVKAPSRSSPAKAATASAGSSALPRALRPATPAVATPAVSNDAHDRESLAFPRDDYREPPPAVALELKHMSESYQELPSLRRLPDFLSLNALLALMPDSGERDFLRQAVHIQLEGGEGGALLGAYLDDEKRLLALWLTGHFTQALAIYDGQRLAGQATIQRGRAMLRDVLAEADGSRAELLVQHITTMSVCCLPSSLDVYRVSKHGALSKVLSFEKSHADVGPGVRWGFMNHFEFKDDRVLIQRIFPDAGPSYDFVYDARTRRYQPTSVTTQLLVDERRKRVNADAGDDGPAP